MEPIRRIASQADFGTAREQASIQYATTIFERLAYLLRRATRPLDDLDGDLDDDLDADLDADLDGDLGGDLGSDSGPAESGDKTTVGRATTAAAE
jgi:hypothetical protein